MVKKKKNYNEQKQLVYSAGQKQSYALAIISLQQNFEMLPGIRTGNCLQLSGDLKKHKYQARLRCFYSYNCRVPARTLGLSRYTISRKRLNKYLSQYHK